MKIKSFSQLAETFYGEPMKVANPDDPVNGRYTIDQMNKSKAAAIAQVRKYLDDIGYWSKNLPMMQHGEKDYVTVSYMTNYMGAPCKISLVIPSYMDAQDSGIKCFKSVSGGVVNRTLANYFSIAQGLVKFGSDMLIGDAKKVFGEKYGHLAVAKTDNIS